MTDVQVKARGSVALAGDEFNYELARFIPFRDLEEARRVRKITKQEITRHRNPDFKIRVIEEPSEFYFQFALDIVRRIREKLERNEKFVGIFPVGPMPQYSYAASMINDLGLSCHHVHTFNMDEYADQDGNTAPVGWAGSFQKAMLENFFLKIDRKLRPPDRQIHFPTKEALPDYAKMIEDVGGADVCYGGIGWCGHIAFWEAHLGFEFNGDLPAFKNAGPRLVELHPMTIMQNALHSFGGDWSWVPPKANTIGPQQILGARDRSFWLDGYLGGGVSWQRFIARLVAHGPVTPLVPGSILQETSGSYTILGPVADNVEIHMA
jgi:glucosamine-6-phosphate deaminase